MPKNNNYQQKLTANVNIVNSQLRASDIPTRLRPDGSNLQEVYQGINENVMKQNQYITGLTNWISTQVFNELEFNSPLQHFVQDNRDKMGIDVQEIYTGLSTEHNHTGLEGAAEAFKRYVTPTIQAIHTPNRDVNYYLSVSKDKLRWAFESLANLEMFHSQLFQSVYTKAQLDEYNYIRDTMHNFIKDGASHLVKVPTIGLGSNIDNKQYLAQAVVKYSNDLEYERTWNRTGVINFAPKRRQVLILNTDADAALKTGLSAFVYNKEDITLPRQTVIDSFGDDRIVAMLVDERVFQVYTTYAGLEQQLNAPARFINFVYGITQIISLSAFSNSVTFVTDDLEDIKQYISFDQPLDVLQADTKEYVAWLPEDYVSEDTVVEVELLNAAGIAVVETALTKIEGSKITYTLKKGNAPSKLAAFTVQLKATIGEEPAQSVYGIQTIQIG